MMAIRDGLAVASAGSRLGAGDELLAGLCSLLCWTRIGKIGRTHLKNYDPGRRGPFIGSPNNGVNRLKDCLPGFGLNRVLIPDLHREGALHHVYDRWGGMAVPSAHVAGW